MQSAQHPSEPDGVWPRIEARLTHLQPKFPADEVALAAAHWGEVGERFIDELEHAAADPSDAAQGRYLRQREEIQEVLRRFMKTDFPARGVAGGVPRQAESSAAGLGSRP